VFTPKGKVMEFTIGATPLDFAYQIHSEIGHHCIGARVNRRMVPLRYHLQTGDVVEILTSDTQTPHLEWLDYVATGKARARIRQRLREMGRLEPLDGQYRRHAVDARPQGANNPVSVDAQTREKLIRVHGANGQPISMAKCCKPAPGQPVIGYRTRKPGIMVHRADCRNFGAGKRDPRRMVEASWDGERTMETGMRVTTGQRPNVLADITSAIRPMNLSIIKARFVPGENGKSTFEFIFEAPDEESVERVAATLRTVSGVSDVTQLEPTAVPD